jgi:hypothetical protein
MNWISGTNALGSAGHREHHAEGDMVGQEQQQPVQQQAVPAEQLAQPASAQPAAAAPKRRGLLGGIGRMAGRVAGGMAKTAAQGVVNAGKNAIKATPVYQAGKAVYDTGKNAGFYADGGNVRSYHAYGDVAGQDGSEQQPYAGYQQPQSIGQTAQPTNQVSQQMPSQQPIEQQQQMSRGGVAGYKRGGY